MSSRNAATPLPAFRLERLQPLGKVRKSPSLAPIYPAPRCTRLRNAVLPARDAIHVRAQLRQGTRICHLSHGRSRAVLAVVVARHPTNGT